MIFVLLIGPIERWSLLNLSQSCPASHQHEAFWNKLGYWNVHSYTLKSQFLNAIQNDKSAQGFSTSVTDAIDERISHLW